MNIQNKSIEELKLLGESIYNSPNLQLIYDIYTFKEIVIKIHNHWSGNYQFDYPKWAMKSYIYFLTNPDVQHTYDTLFEWINATYELCQYICD